MASGVPTTFREDGWFGLLLLMPTMQGIKNHSFRLLQSKGHFRSAIHQNSIMVSTLYDGVLVSETTSHTSLSVIKGSQQGALTREELQRMAIDFARVLRNGGIQPGDTVTLVDPNTVEFVVAFLGTTFARAIVAPLNQNYTTVSECIERCCRAAAKEKCAPLAGQALRMAV